MSDFKGRFTDFFLKTLKTKICKEPPAKEYDLRERDGFGIRVRRTGSIIFFYMYTVDHKRKFMRLGTYPPEDTSPQGISLSTARQMHAEAFSKVMAGIDPLDQPTPEDDQQCVAETLTVAQLKARYIAHITTNLVPRSVKHQDSTLEKHLIPVLGSRPLDTVRRADAISLVEVIARSTRGAANNCIKAARAMFEFGVLREYLTVNPFIKVTRAVPQARPRSRNRNLSPDEIQILWNNLTLGYGSSEVKRILKLVLLLGQRPGEIAAMKFEHIDGDWWIIPKDETKIGRNPNVAEDLKFDQSVYLTNLAKELIGEGTSGYVFAARGGRPLTEGALSGYVRREVVGDDGTLIKAKHLGMRRPWVPHDLRRTMATRVVDDLDTPHEHVNAILGHLIPGVLGIYVRSRYDSKKREVALAWENKLLEIVRNPTASTVVAPTVEPRRVLTDEEIRVVWQRLSALNSVHSSGALRLILVSGQSVGACAGFSRADTISDTTGTWWQVENNRIYLTDIALQLVGDKGGYAFAPRKNGHINIATLSYHILNKECFGISKFTPDDLRVTVASKIRELGAPAGVVSTFFQNSPGNPWELRHWLTCWEKELFRIVSMSTITV